MQSALVHNEVSDWLPGYVLLIPVRISYHLINRRGDPALATTEVRFFQGEMRSLFELTGFEVVAEYSDFLHSQSVYGAEQLWVARKIG